MWDGNRSRKPGRRMISVGGSTPPPSAPTSPFFGGVTELERCPVATRWPAARKLLRGFKSRSLRHLQALPLEVSPSPPDAGATPANALGDQRRLGANPGSAALTLCGQGSLALPLIGTPRPPGKKSKISLEILKQQRRRGPHYR